MIRKIKMFLVISNMFFVCSICNAETITQKNGLFSIQISEDWQSNNNSNQIMVQHKTEDQSYMTIQFSRSNEIKQQLKTEKTPVTDENILKRMAQAIDGYILKATPASKTKESKGRVGKRITYEVEYAFPEGAEFSHLKQIYLLHKGYTFNVSLWSVSKSKQNELYKMFKTIKFN